MSQRGSNKLSSTIMALGAVAVLLASGACTTLDDDLETLTPVVGEDGRVAGLSGSYAFRDDDAQERELFTLRATIDEYLTDHHVVGAFALGQFSNIESDPDGREQLWAGLHYHYHHHLSARTAVFAGPQIGLTFFDDSFGNDRSFTYGISGGVRHWLAERVAFTVEPSFLFADFDEENGDDSKDFLVLWGLAFSL